MAHTKTVVLVVEDEPLVRMAIADHLNEVGFTVLEAADADGAIAILLKNLDVRILFTDIDMPGGMDGLRLAAVVSERWPPIHIVVTSGHRTVTASELPSEARFFSKPYDPDHIVSAFDELSSH